VESLSIPGRKTMGKEELNERVIVLTGASSGFGRGAALELAENGASLVLAARRDELLQELAQECEAAGGRTKVVAVDVGDRGDMERLAEEAVAEFGRIDVWINNAGAGVIGRFEDIPLEEHEKLIQTNLVGTIYGSWFALRRFREQGKGILINVGSVAGKVPHAYYASYAASKHGVVGLSAALRQELHENGIEDIRVCTVMPGAHDTPFFEHAANYSGHEVLAPPPVYDPQKVVDVLVRLATDPEDEVLVGGAAKVMAFAHSVAPDTTEKLMGHESHKVQMEQAPLAPPSAGGLREPSAGGTGVRGGMKEKMKRVKEESA
jgi:short-subunit dehydrogenase